jgi:hypothetical protein
MQWEQQMSLMAWLDGSMPCYSVIVYNITNGLPQHPLLIEDSLYALHMCCLLHSPSLTASLGLHCSMKVVFGYQKKISPLGIIRNDRSHHEIGVLWFSHH